MPVLVIDMRRATSLTGLVLVMLAGCGSLQPVDYPPPATELGEHPGLFSGPDGEMALASGRTSLRKKKSLRP
jgi:hypothetical protein